MNIPVLSGTVKYARLAYDLRYFLRQRISLEQSKLVLFASIIHPLRKIALLPLIMLLASMGERFYHSNGGISSIFPDAGKLCGRCSQY